MVKFKMCCPECGAVMITASPQAVIWEMCPGCRMHFWDRYDALMAEVYAPEKHNGVNCERNA
jgi:Zn-finger nucleic acid-binding protein